VVLKRLTITGFKSFANKTVLDFEAGLTGIVGPNGSGKSNVADAIRWAMGEQSKGKLRLKDREEVVFSGSEKRARASFAEVIMLFDNTSGVFPLDVTEVEISRRLYRSGESDFRLNGRSVRFVEVAALLAEAGFGRDSYAVVGQGMIDTLLISSPVERKLLFEEAAGIRGFELKRAEAMKRLNATEANLVRLRDIQHELEPRLAKLKEAMVATERRNELTQQVGALRQQLVDAESHWIFVTTTTLTAENQQCNSQLAETERQITELESAITAIRQSVQSERETQAKALTHLARLEEERDALSVSMAERQVKLAELQADIDRAKSDEEGLVAAQSSLVKIEKKITDLEHELDNNAKSSARAESAVASANAEIQQAESRLRELRSRTTDGSQRQYVDHALGLVKAMAQHLQVPQEVEVEELRLLVHKTGRLLSYASKTGELDVLEELKKSQISLEALMRRRETALEHQANIVLSRRSLEIDLGFQRNEAKRIGEDISRFQNLDHLSLSSRQTSLKAEEKGAVDRMRQINAELATCRQNISSQASALSNEEHVSKATELERAKAKHSSLQHDAQELAQKARHVASVEGRLASQQKEWGITATARSGNISDIERQLETVTARLEAESTYANQVEADYRDTSQREAELVTQLQDLEVAQSNLHEVVGHLDKCIRERFEQNFAGIAEHFNRSFQRLFDGGSAGLQLVRDEESGDYGINIKVNPKGKRLASLEVLSGGERALAGVALLAAILEVNPSPFIVLDEIDAALDEANSGRLAVILRELAQKSQLIVITHNRQTMEAAKVLFGVSMNDHHVSHLLSLRLEEATQLAAR
jgi:chromosome segregation protein